MTNLLTEQPDGPTRTVLPETVERARPIIPKYVERFGSQELLEIAADLGMATDGAKDWGVWWERESEDLPMQRGQLHIKLGDLQFVAFAAAVAANGKAMDRWYGNS